MSASAPPPRLSVVVVPLAAGEALRRLRAALASPGMLPAGAEVLVVDSGDTVPGRRALGVRRSCGELVALLEDTVLPDPGWGHALVELHAAHPDAAAIGGTLRLGPALTPAATALALLDYGRFLRPGEVSARADALPGCNLSFKRAALERAGALAAPGLFEAELVPRLPGGARLESALAATLVAADPRGARLASRFQHGRLYAGRRYLRAQWLRRLLHALLAPLLPALFAARALAAARRAGAALPPSLWVPLAAFSLAGSAGELVGYLRGPGRAEESWR
jgi:hypothetical protein